MVGGLDLASCQLLNTGTEVIAVYILCMLPEVQRVGWWNLFPLLLPPLFLPPPSHAPSLLAPPKLPQPMWPLVQVGKLHPHQEPSPKML